jgi:hypothetical protein
MSNVIKDVVGSVGDILGGGVAGSGAMDPTAAGIYQGQLGDYRNMLANYQGGTNSPYVQSMLAPAQQQNAQTYGNVMQDQALRGIRGSSFGDQSLANTAATANQNIANISGQAQYNQLLQQLGIQNAIGGIGQAYQGQGQRAQQMAQEARSRGLGALGGLAGGIGGFMLGGPMGSAVGAKVGSGITPQSYAKDMSIKE